MIDKNKVIKELERKVSICNLCSELSAVRKIVSLGFGNLNPKFMIIGQNPGIPLEHEIGQDYGTVIKNSKMGRYITKILKSVNLTFDDIYFTNICKCPSPNNRTINDDEISNCIGYLIDQINLLNPKVIITLGSLAKNEISKLNLKDVCILNWYHPSYLWRLNINERSSIENNMVKELKKCL